MQLKETYNKGVESMEEVTQLVVFKLGKESYGVSITNVKEIIEMKSLYAIPEAPGYIEGMLNIRGEVHVIFNIRKKFGMNDGEYSTNPKIVLVNEKKVGFIVDEVSKILNIEKENIENVDAVLKGFDKKYIDGIAKIEEEIIIILNLCKILSIRDEVEVEKTIENQNVKNSV